MPLDADPEVTPQVPDTAGVEPGAAHRLNLHMLGTGSGLDGALGCSAAVLRRGTVPLLMIDAGFDVPDRYRDAYGEPPPAVWVSHCHLDHIGGFEKLFGMAWWRHPRHPIKVFCRAELVAMLHARVAGYPNVIAEGGANFWDAFHLVPVDGSFHHAGLQFETFATRHHQQGTSFGLRLPGVLVYTGDTRPVPEVLTRCRTETIFHDCAWHSNPSHTGWEDLAREYDADTRARLVLYHHSARDAARLAAAGARVAVPGAVYEL